MRWQDEYQVREVVYCNVPLATVAVDSVPLATGKHWVRAVIMERTTRGFRVRCDGIVGVFDMSVERKTDIRKRDDHGG